MVFRILSLQKLMVRIFCWVMLSHCGIVDTNNRFSSSQQFLEASEEEDSEFEQPYEGDYESPLARPRLLDEGSCLHLACQSRYAVRVDANTPGAITCPNNTRHAGESRLVSFSCLGTGVSCNDDDLWLAVPSLQCQMPTFYTVCYQGRSLVVQARDTSDSNHWEANRGVQKVLGIQPGENPRVRIYEATADVSNIPLCSDPCVRVKAGQCLEVDGKFCNRCPSTSVCLPDLEGNLSCLPMEKSFCDTLKPGTCLFVSATSSCGCYEHEKCVQVKGSQGRCVLENKEASIGYGGSAPSPDSDFASAMGDCPAASAREASCTDFSEWSCGWNAESCGCLCSKPNFKF